MKLTTSSSMFLMLFFASILNINLGSFATMALQTDRLRSLIFTISISPSLFSKAHGYDVIRIPDFGMTTDVSKPMLPVKIVPVLLPPYTDVEKIELKTSKKEELTGNYRIFPAQFPAIGAESKLPKLVKPDPAVYNSNQAYPGVLFEDAGVYWMQGYRILNIRIFPVQYFPRSGRIFYHKSMEFKVSLTSTNKSPFRSTDSTTKDMIRKIVVNPEKADKWVAPSGINSISNAIDYVIITNPLFQDEFQALADWKSQNGISAKVYNTTWIYNNYTGVDNAEKIRNFIIKMQSEHGTSAVLLGGDYDIVPTRYIYMEDCLDDPHEAGGGLSAAYKPTDYYYACLDGDWDLDDDGRYLEQIDTDADGRPETCEEPIPDFYPEVYVGRMPATSETTAEFLVNRTISYEKNPPPGDWRKKAIVLGAISNYENEDRKGWGKTDDALPHEHVKFDFLTPGFDVVTMYEQGGLDPSTYPCDYPLTIANVETQVSYGCSILSTAGHGSVEAQWRKIWASDDGDDVPETKEPNEMDWKEFLDTTMNLSNGERLPLTYMDACFCGKFDNITGDCFGEWMLKLMGGGAIGVVAASRISYYRIGWDKGYGYNQELLYLFWKEFFKAENNYLPGKVLYASKLAYYLEGFNMTWCASKKDLLIYNLLGDPYVSLPVPALARMELHYDDGIWEQGWTWLEPGGMFAVRFTPPTAGRLMGCSFRIWSPATVKVHVMDALREDIITPFSVTPTSTGWCHMDLSAYEVTVSSDVDFYIAIEWTVANEPYLGDDTSDPDGRSWNYNGVEWSQYADGDYLIRAVIAPARHDIAVTNVVPSKAVVGAGYSISINVTVENQGNFTETFNVTAYYDANHIETRTVTDLAPNTNTTLTFLWNTTDVTPGNYTLSAYASPVPGETDTADNTFPDGTITILAYIHDVAAVDVKSSKTVIGQGCSLYINVTVENQGDVTETFNVTAYANTTIIETKEITLTSGNSTTVTFSWNTIGFAKGNYTISAYAHPVPYETDTADNNFTDGWVIVAMVGDITGPDGFPDGKVEMRDVSLVASKYGVNYPDPRYDPNCDVTGLTFGVADGKIEMRDVSMIAIEYGKTDP